MQVVRSFGELVATPFGRGVNAFCWRRELPGDFGEIVRAVGPGEGIVALEPDRLRALSLSAAGEIAREVLLADLERLEARGLAPELNCIHAYPRDDEEAVLSTDVYSFHADRAPVPAETWLCTYFGAPSQGLGNEDAVRHIENPILRARLLAEYGGADDEAFAAYLEENCYDLHYAARPGAEPFSFGLHHLWRIAVEYPGCPVPPCIHRAPASEPRLLLIS